MKIDSHLFIRNYRRYVTVVDLVAGKFCHFTTSSSTMKHSDITVYRAGLSLAQIIRRNHIGHTRTPRAPPRRLFNRLQSSSIINYSLLRHFPHPSARLRSRSHSSASSHDISSQHRPRNTQIWFLQIAAISLRSTSPFDNICIYTYYKCIDTRVYACSWLIYVYTYAILMRIPFIRIFADLREVRTCTSVACVWPYVWPYRCMSGCIFVRVSCAGHRRFSAARSAYGMCEWPVADGG